MQQGLGKNRGNIHKLKKNNGSPSSIFVLIPHLNDVPTNAVEIGDVDRASVKSVVR